jgi:uncharacterized membrane protein YhdT
VYLLPMYLVPFNIFIIIAVYIQTKTKGNNSLDHSLKIIFINLSVSMVIVIYMILSVIFMDKL